MVSLTHTQVYQVQPQGTQVNQAETDTWREKVGRGCRFNSGLSLKQEQDQVSQPKHEQTLSFIRCTGHME